MRSPADATASAASAGGRKRRSPQRPPLTRVRAALRWHAGRQSVADAPHGLDRIAQGAELLAQAQNRVIARAIAVDGRLAPHGVVQIRPAEGTPAVAQQQMQDAEFSSRQVERLAVE